ncbi:MAG: sigma-54 dependent transcriptional regulator [Gallionellaceae bacterium]
MSNNINLPTLLIVDDDPLIRESLHLALSDDFDIYLAEDRPHAIRLLRDLTTSPDLALVDLGLPPTPHRPEEGFKLIAELLAHSPSIKVIALSGQDDQANARHARALGAIEFIAKPCPPATIKQQLQSALRIPLNNQDATTLKQNPIIGTSAPIMAMRSQIELFATSPFPVLIEGESGSGKELVAAALQSFALKKSSPFITFNCAAISPNLIESALFGHLKGSFTGATTTKVGFFEEAGEGTLFLDEIGELPLDLQSKLLRVLENGEFQRVGETTTRNSSARIVAATNRNLKNCVRDGSFRLDLYHRLSIFTIQVPPLRNLGADKFLLLEHFATHFAKQSQKPTFSLDGEAEKAWEAYSFPGNTRELRNIVIRLSTKYPGQKISIAQLEPELDLSPSPSEHVDDLENIQLAMRQGDFNLDEQVMNYTGRHINIAMAMAQGNMSEAAKLLGIARTTLYSRIEAQQKHKIQNAKFTNQ